MLYYIQLKYSKRKSSLVILESSTHYYMFCGDCFGDFISRNDMVVQKGTGKLMYQKVCGLIHKLIASGHYETFYSRRVSKRRK